MRLRLRIERNELPAVSVLWTIEPTALKQTVAQFLQRVDERVPLEGESWGLEDYSVTVGGYEAFHFSEVADCFQNEDEIIIKPLQTAEVRARHITGRDQISTDGRHLLDGVPFGKPLLKRPRRPEVHIPPRKRQKFEEAGQSILEDLILKALAGGEDEDEDDEPDEDFGVDEENAEDGADEEIEESEDGDEESDEDDPPVTTRRTRRQRLIDDEAQELDEDEDEESDDDFAGKNTPQSSEDDSDSSDDSSDTSSSDSDSSSEASWNGIETSPVKSPVVPTNASSKDEASAYELPELPEKPAALKFNNPPFEGHDHTKARNARRRDQRKLKHLKESGVLDPHATMDDMKKWLQTQGVSNGSEVKQAADAPKPEEKATMEAAMEAARQRLVASINAGGVDVSNAGPFQHDSTAAKAPLTNGDGEVDDDEAPEEESSVAPIARLNGFMEQADAAEAEDSPDSRRKRINLAGANRLVFGSLGVRTPKTQADKDALQKKLSARALRNVPAEETQSAQVEGQEDQDPEAWRDKIELSAVECLDEGVELSTPPFPFQQRWDPQYQLSKKRKKSSNFNSSKARKFADDYVESYDKYNTNGDGDALNYDEPDDEEEDDPYWEEGALLGEDPGGVDMEPIDDGFPLLPLDLAELPDIAQVDAREGDFITYKELLVSAATNWTPKTLDRTIRLESKTEDDCWNVTFATRDKPPKKYDDEGNRVYSKFEMEGLSDNEDEDDDKVLSWDMLQQPKLLLRAASE